MKKRVDTGKGGGKGEFDGDRGDDGGDGEGAEETRAEFGGRVFQEGDIAGGQADTIPNLERGRAAMLVGKGGLLGLGEIMPVVLSQSNNCDRHPHETQRKLATNEVSMLLEVIKGCQTKSSAD